MGEHITRQMDLYMDAGVIEYTRMRVHMHEFITPRDWMLCKLLTSFNVVLEAGCQFTTIQLLIFNTAPSMTLGNRTR